MKKIIFIFVAIVVFPCLGLETYLTMENDTFLKKQDNDYTHGTKFETVTSKGYHFMGSQTMYAPSDLRRKEHIVGDRPYCGMLLGGVGYEFFYDPKFKWTHYGEIDFGIIGPGAMCKETQTMIHKLLNCKKPEGWNNQLHNEFVVNAQWWTKYNWYIQDWLVLVPRVGTAVGTIQDFVEIGCDLKFGYNIRPTVANGIIFSGTRGFDWKKKLTLYGYVGVDERYYLYNHILEGSLFNNKDKDLKVDIEPFVTEFKFGIVLKYEDFYITYYGIFRTDEFKHQKNAPDYGGICVGWSF